MDDQMARQPQRQEGQGFEQRYAEIQQRLEEQQPENGFNIEDLFTPEEWAQIGDGQARQRFGRRFGQDVNNGRFPRIARNEQRYERGGNEARYNYIEGL
ncbi:DUF1413 domain-containing protein [Phaeobacter sp. JH20_37]|uniref:DUF1413 domain-containing protein n=1 Tax=Phaeobacter sp. JH20_37 TaxID=3112494 RepID=UPI003A88CD0F